MERKRQATTCISGYLVAHWGGMEASVRAPMICGLGFVFLGMLACGDSTLFGGTGTSASAGQGAGATTGGGSSAEGGATAVSGSGAAAGSGSIGGGPGIGGGAPTGVGGGAGGDDAWVQPPCDPPCDFFSTCCDKGDGSGATCVSDATGCKCDINAQQDSCGGFGSSACCADTGSHIGECTNSNIGCACNPDSSACGFGNACCDKGEGFECANNARECLCEATPQVCDFIYNTCCDKGDGKRCYQNGGGCL